MSPSSKSVDVSALADRLAGLDVGERNAIEEQANEHAYMYGNHTVGFALAKDWLEAGAQSQGVRGGWAKAIPKGLLNARGGSSSSSNDNGRTPRARRNRGPASANATPETLAARILEMSPAEIQYRLQQNAGALIACMQRAGLETWHERWFVVYRGSTPDVTNSIPRLYAIAGGRNTDAAPDVEYAGSELTAYDLFCLAAARGKLDVFHGEGDEAQRTSLVDLAQDRARRLAWERPWLPRYALRHAQGPAFRLYMPDPPRPFYIDRPDKDTLLDIKTDPIEQPIPGQPRLAAASQRFLASTPFDVSQRTADGLPALSPDTLLSFDRAFLAARTPRKLKNWYVVFIGKQVGVFQHDQDARDAYGGISSPNHCAYKGELAAQMAFQQAWLLGEVAIRAA